MTRSMADVDELCNVLEEKLVLVNIDKQEINFYEFEIQKSKKINTKRAQTEIKTYFWKPKKMSVILKSEKNWDVEDRATFDREYRILSSLKHKNIVQVFGYTLITSNSESPERFALVIELAAGSLYDYLDEKTTPTTKFGWLTDIASAVDYLHNGAIVKTLHRDLKPHNVLVFTRLLQNASLSRNTARKVENKFKTL